MAAGIPGAGIGGLFYLLSAVTLPFRSAWRRLRGKPDTLSLREGLWQLGMVAGIALGIWVAGWVLGLIVPSDMLADAGGTGARPEASIARSVIKVTALAAGFVTLGGVLAIVEVARMAAGRRRRTVARRMS